MLPTALQQAMFAGLSTGESCVPTAQPWGTPSTPMIWNVQRHALDARRRWGAYVPWSALTAGRLCCCVGIVVSAAKLPAHEGHRRYRQGRPPAVDPTVERVASAPRGPYHSGPLRQSASAALHMLVVPSDTACPAPCDAQQSG